MGIEPTASDLEGPRSVPLSYIRINAQPELHGSLLWSRFYRLRLIRDEERVCPCTLSVKRIAGVEPAPPMWEIRKSSGSEELHPSTVRETARPLPVCDLMYV